jgi:hypothetical protein
MLYPTAAPTPSDLPERADVPRSPQLLDQVREAIRRTHYSIRTEEAYVDWIKRFVLFHKTAQGEFHHPQEMGAAESEAFLTHMAVDRQVAASTQNQALSALPFLYRHVLSSMSSPQAGSPPIPAPVASGVTMEWCDGGRSHPPGALT